MGPSEPPPSEWVFPPPSEADEHGIVAVGADLEVSTLLAAYRRGLFPMPLGRGQVIGWWSPDPRGVIEIGDLRVSRSLRRSCRRYSTTVDTDFVAVIDLCAQLPRPGGWISPAIRDAYVALHQHGWAHSVEVRDGGPDGELVGGLYGVNVGGLFAGESMFHTATDASKVALVALHGLLDDGSPRLIDTQWLTPHLASLGATEWSRHRYLRRLRDLVAVPGPAALHGR